MDIEIISGLHTCKPGNTPSVNQIKTFLVTEETSQRTGNRWIKIRSAAPDKGGQHYKVLSIRPTGTSDAHGNVSFNLEIEKAEAPPVPQQTAPVAPYANATAPVQPLHAYQPPPQPPQPKAFDTVQQHVTRAANLYNLCFETVDTIIRDKMRARNIDLHAHPAWFQAITTTLFIQAKDQGYIAHMSDREQKPNIPQKEPY
jgi:hypothetical protein